MKELRILLTPKEHKDLSKLKRKLTWHDFILLLLVHLPEAIERGDLEVGDSKKTVSAGESKSG